MHPFPHHYDATATASPSGDIALDSPQLPTLTTNSPVEFGGPGERWTPEALLVGALVDCFALTFRSVANASRLPWTGLDARACGTLERVDGATRFTSYDLYATLQVTDEATIEKAKQLLERAEHLCLISNSLNAPVHLHLEVHVGVPA